MGHNCSKCIKLKSKNLRIISLKFKLLIILYNENKNISYCSQETTKKKNLSKI